MFTYAINHYAAYLLVLLRVVAFIGVSPVFSVRAWPVWAKLGLAAFLALWLSPTVANQSVPDPFAAPDRYILLALKESVIGALLGFLVTLVFSATSVAGQVFDIQIGFSSATLFDPAVAQATGLSNSFLSILFTLYFLGLNGLDGLLLGLMQSYEYVGLGAFSPPSSGWETLTHLLTLTMALGIQVGAPLLVALLLSDVTFAFLSRAVPQMNVFVVGQPAKLFIGLTAFAAVMPGVVYLFGTVFRTLFSQMNDVLRWLGG
jgi:flagellar biosynthesis protein FliR